MTPVYVVDMYIFARSKLEFAVCTSMVLFLECFGCCPIVVVKF